MDKMEEQLANLAAWVQTAVVSGSSRESSIRSAQTYTFSQKLIQFFQYAVLI
jgi:hypothetical protein